MRASHNRLWSLLLLGLATCSPPAFVPRTVAHGTLAKQDGVWVMQLWGTPEQRGDAAGELVGEQIRWALPRYLKSTLRAEKPTGLPLTIVRQMRATIPAPHLAQLRALAQSSGADLDSLLLANLAPEVYGGLACSCLAAQGDKSASGQVILARNLDWYGGDVLEELGLVVVEEVDGRRLASVTWPGLVGVVTGMNDHGLSVANLVVLGQKATPAPGLPAMFALRSILEHQNDLESAVTWLAAQERTVPQNYAFADANAATVLETWRKRFRRRDPIAGFVAVGNLFDEDEASHPDGRYRRMMKIGARAELDLATLQAGLRDVALGDMNVQAVVMIPATRQIHLSTRARPAADGPYHPLDLAPLFTAKR